jgi:RNA polymerase sigma-70 factor, ECF subfamily
MPRAAPLPRVHHLAPGVSTAELVARARRRDGAAESLLYRRHAAELLAISGRLLRSTSAGEDVVHDTFLLVFARLHQLRDPAQFRGWALCIAVSLVRRRLRRERVLRFVGLDAAPPEALESRARSGLSVEARAELAVLDVVLARLPTQQRLAWALRHVEGEKLEDVAIALGKSLATTKRYLAAAEAHLAAHVRLESPP